MTSTNHTKNYLDPGKYLARATQACLSRTPNGIDFVNIVFDVDTGSIIKTPLEWAGWFGDDPVKNKRTIECLRICGWAGNDLSDLTGITENQVLLVVEDDERGGKCYSRIRFVNAPGGGPGRNALPTDEIKQLAMRMRTLCEEVPPFTGRGAKKAVPQLLNVGPDMGDDINF